MAPVASHRPTERWPGVPSLMSSFYKGLPMAPPSSQRSMQGGKGLLAPERDPWAWIPHGHLADTRGVQHTCSPLPQKSRARLHYQQEDQPQESKCGDMSEHVSATLAEPALWSTAAKSSMSWAGSASLLHHCLSKGYLSSVYCMPGLRSDSPVTRWN